MNSRVPSTLWRISDFQRQRDLMGQATTVLSTTLVAELQQLQARRDTDDVLEVLAAFMRHRESALLYLAYGPQVWPLTLFPSQGLVHSPRPLAAMQDAERLAQLRLLAAERPILRPPGHYMHERVANPEQYQPLAPLLWHLALNGPRQVLLSEIAGRAAYRLAAGQTHGFVPRGALAPAVSRLRLGAVPVAEIARWPGMSEDRACRLLNALYLTDALMVTRSHPSARDPAEKGWRGFFARRH